MLSAAENELLTRTSAGTPSGDLFRRYWIPILEAREVAAPDGPPVRVKILGENLVAFRNSRGNLGLLAEACAHRGASLALGRNEESGLRCINHGWKFDPDGTCTDIPNEPPESQYRMKVRQPSYPTHEAGGVIWGFLGPADEIPPPPEFEWTSLPANQRMAMRVLQECNYLQGIEGGVDSSHVGFLHRSFVEGVGPWGIKGGGSLGITVSQLAPRLEVERTSYGFRYAAIRLASEDKQYVRITPFIFPWYTFVPTGDDEDGMFHAWVPRDDHSTWAWDMHYNRRGELDVQEHVNTRGLWVDENFRKLRNIDNNWMQDREAMITKSFSGVYGIMNQDQSVQESMGPFVDRTREHLATSDKAIIALRRVLLDALKAFERGDELPAMSLDVPYEAIRSDVRIINRDQDWREVFPLPGQNGRGDSTDVERYSEVSPGA